MMKSLFYTCSSFVLCLMFFTSCQENSVKPEKLKPTVKVISKGAITGQAALDSTINDLEKITAHPGNLKMYHMVDGKKVRVDPKKALKQLKTLKAKKPNNRQITQSIEEFIVNSYIGIEPLSFISSTQIVGESPWFIENSMTYKAEDLTPEGQVHSILASGTHDSTVYQTNYLETHASLSVNSYNVTVRYTLSCEHYVEDSMWGGGWSGHTKYSSAARDV